MKVSVITTLYYGKKYLSILLDVIMKNICCLSDQDQIEYIIVNDSPTEVITQDEINQLMRRIKLKYDFIIVENQLSVQIMTNEQNSGIHLSRVHGVLQSSGDYIVFLDQDDLLTENALSIFIQQMKRNPNADVCIANGYRQYKDNGIPLYKSERIIPMLSNEKYYLYGTDLIFSPGQCMIKRSAISTEWLTNILSINGCDDFMLWLFMLNNHKQFLGITDKLYYHMETESNYSGSFDAMQKSFFSMCSLLERITVYPTDKVNILRRRGELKSVLRKKGNIINKTKKIFSNLDIVFYTIKYKNKGYH